MNLVCTKCFSNDLVSSFISTNGDWVDRCAYCGSKDVLVLSIKEVAGFIDQGIRRKYVPLDTLSDEYLIYLEQFLHPTKVIDLLVYDLSIFNKTNKEILLEDLFRALTPSWKELTDGAEDFYEAGEREFIDDCFMDAMEDQDYAVNYSYFKHRVKYENRYLLSRDSPFLTFLKDIIENHKEYTSIIHEDRRLYRARYSDTITPYKSCNVLEQELGPPPSLNTESYRMQPKGITYFYLSDRVDTARKEISNSSCCIPTDDNASVAEFVFLRDIKLLDLTHTPQSVIIDIFSEEYDREREHLWSFLEHFRDDISEPAPEDDDLHYIPTQVLAEFFKNVGYDAIRYKSAIDQSGNNYVLFLNSNGMSDPRDFRKFVRLKSVLFPDGSREIF